MRQKGQVCPDGHMVDTRHLDGVLQMPGKIVKGGRFPLGQMVSHGKCSTSRPLTPRVTRCGLSKDKDRRLEGVMARHSYHHVLPPMISETRMVATKL